MVTKGLAIGRDVHQLGVVALSVEPGHQAIRESIAALQQAFERDVVRDRLVIEKQIDVPSIAQAASISASRIDTPA